MTKYRLLSARQLASALAESGQPPTGLCVAGIRRRGGRLTQSGGHNDCLPVLHGLLTALRIGMHGDSSWVSDPAAEGIFSRRTLPG